jgi:hypothetical protein
MDQGKRRNMKSGRGVRQGRCLSPIIFNLYDECFTNKALECFRYFKTGVQAIPALKYADDLVLLAKEQTVLQNITDGLTEIGNSYEMDVNVEKLEVKTISREPSPL